jgi:hypothetical protein
VPDGEVKPQEQRTADRDTGSTRAQLMELVG